MRVIYYPEEDALYIQLLDSHVSHGRAVDDRRHVDYTTTGEVAGVEFLYVSDGIDLNDIPDVDTGLLESLLDKMAPRIMA